MYNDKNQSVIDTLKLTELGFDLTKLEKAKGRGRPRSTTPEQEQSILVLVDAGYSIRSIAEALGISTNTAQGIVGKHGGSQSDE